MHCNEAKEPTVTDQKNDEIARLRQALDQAIYALEIIRNRAARGVSLDPGWQCSTIEDVASEALTTLTTLLVPEREAA
mgnify:FL=1